MISREATDREGERVESWFSISVVEITSNNSGTNFMNHYATLILLLSEFVCLLTNDESINILFFFIPCVLPYICCHFLGFTHQHCHFFFTVYGSMLFSWP